jgi:prepilin-type N-terminal cleavage/methylation domain-containing protein
LGIRRLHLKLGSQKGFTLIELLVVVAILGVLAMVVVPNMANFMKKGSLSAANGEAAALQTAVDGYMADHGGAIPTVDEVVEAKLLRGTLKGSYEVLADGTLKGTDGWETLEWNGDKLQWEEKKE